MPADESLLDPIGFAEKTLGFKLYPWQEDALTWLPEAVGLRKKFSLRTPNGAGKDSIVIATAALWWLFIHERGQVRITSSDGLQLDRQTLKNLAMHAAKFPEWTFNYRDIKTPTGGNIVLFTTDEAKRVEGDHRETMNDGLPEPAGALLLIANEAKSVPDPILDAFDRCTYDALLYASTPGPKRGRFYESQMYPELGFERLSVGLSDCPHKSQDIINDLVAKYGPDSPSPNPQFLASTLHGEFMDDPGEGRFNKAGLELIRERAETFERHWRSAPQMEQHGTILGELSQQPFQLAPSWVKNHDSGWCWRSEPPISGCRYIGFCDPTTGAQAEGSLKRDTHGVGILRLAYTDPRGTYFEDEVVAVLHHEGGCRWDNDIMAERFALLLKHYDCPAIVEANNYGGEVIRLLQLAGCKLWRRHKRDHKNPGKLLETVGFMTTAGTKNEWVGALGRSIREQELVCNYLPAALQFCTFILNEKGTGEAQAGAFDDFCTGVGLALYARESATVFPIQAPIVSTAPSYGGCFITNHQSTAQTHGACS